MDLKAGSFLIKWGWETKVANFASKFRTLFLIPDTCSHSFNNVSHLLLYYLCMGHLIGWVVAFVPNISTMEGPQTNKSMNWANLQSDTHLFMFHAVVISSSLSWETYAWVEGAWSRERYFAQIMDEWVTILLTIEREVFFRAYNQPQSHIRFLLSIVLANPYHHTPRPCYL